MEEGFHYGVELRGGDEGGEGFEVGMGIGGLERWGEDGGEEGGIEHCMVRGKEVDDPCHSCSIVFVGVLIRCYD